MLNCFMTGFPFSPTISIEIWYKPVGHPLFGLERLENISIFPILSPELSSTLSISIVVSPRYDQVNLTTVFSGAFFNTQLAYITCEEAGKVALSWLQRLPFKVVQTFASVILAVETLHSQPVRANKKVIATNDKNNFFIACFVLVVVKMPDIAPGR